MRLLLRISLGLIALTILAMPARATLIAFDVTNISGNTFQYDYTVTNDTLSVAIEEFTIFFDGALFQNLRLAAAPTGWDPLAIQPDPILQDDGFLDVLALTAPGIAVGDTLGGFSIQVDFFGTGAPGSQAFDVLSPLTFAVVDSGFTVPNVVSVSGPASLGLLAFGLWSLAAVTWRRQ